MIARELLSLAKFIKKENKKMNEKTKKNFVNSSGNSKRWRRVPRRDIDGNLYLEDIDEFDQYEMIQSYKEQCDIKNIIAAYGGINKIPQIPNVGGTTEGIPKNIRELCDMNNRVRKSWEELPQVQKNYFNNNFETFINTLNSNEGVQGYINAFATPKKAVQAENGGEKHD